MTNNEIIPKNVFTEAKFRAVNAYHARHRYSKRYKPIFFKDKHELLAYLEIMVMYLNFNIDQILKRFIIYIYI